jgi:hypothetical protein
MFALRLVQLIEHNADKLAEGLIHKLKRSDSCSELLSSVPAHELKDRAYEIYRNLTDWMLNKTEAEVEERYIGIGARRARQGVPFSQFLYAIHATKQNLSGLPAAGRAARTRGPDRPNGTAAGDGALLRPCPVLRVHRTRECHAERIHPVAGVSPFSLTVLARRGVEYD